jgi:hypothetical protein
VKHLPLFHHFKAIYQFPKYKLFLVKIVANAALIKQKYIHNPNIIKLKNSMTSKNRTELTKLCKLIKERNKGLFV